MQFKINNKTWEIKELDNKAFIELIEKLKEEQSLQYEGLVLGFCDYASHSIYLNNYQCEEEKKATLTHELIHCWLWSHGASYMSYSEDAVCDTVSASYDFIHKIINDYF